MGQSRTPAKAKYDKLDEKIEELYDLRRKVRDWTRGEGDSMDTTDKES